MERSSYNYLANDLLATVYYWWTFSASGKALGTFPIMMYNYLFPSRLNIRWENSAFDQATHVRTDIRNRISSGPTTCDSMEKIIMICILHYTNKHWSQSAMLYIMYYTTSIIHLAKRAFNRYFYIYLMQFIGTCSVLREQKKRCQVSGVNCQGAGCETAGRRRIPHRTSRISNNYARDMGIGRYCRESNRL